MRWLWPILLISCARPVPAVQLRELEVTEAGLTDTLHFGTLKQGETAVQRIRLRNAMRRPMIVLRDEATCGCVSVVYGQKPVAVGECLEVEVRLDARALQGWQLKLLRLQIDGATDPVRMVVEATVEEEY